MSVIDGLAAAARAERTSTNQPGYCLATVNQYFGGLQSIGPHAGQYPDAIDVWLNDGGKMPGEKNPPRGAVVLWGAVGAPRWAGDVNYGAGDICISLGNGLVRATDYPYSGRVGTCTIDQRTNQIGRPYLGAQTGFLGYTIALGPNNNPAEQPDPEEDTMANAQMHYKRDLDGQLARICWDTSSGWFTDWIESGSDIANGFAVALKTGPSVPGTQSMHDAIVASCDRVLAGK